MVDDVLAGALFEEGGRGATASSPIKVLAKIICSAKRPTRVATSLQNVFHAIVMSKQFVCTIMLPLGHLVPQFDVSFPERLLKIVATRSEIFSLKFTRYRLAAGLRPDPLGELKRSPHTLASIREPTSKGRGRERRGEEGREEREGNGRKRRGGEGTTTAAHKIISKFIFRFTYF